MITVRLLCYSEARPSVRHVLHSPATLGTGAVRMGSKVTRPLMMSGPCQGLPGLLITGRCCTLWDSAALVPGRVPVHAEKLWLPHAGCVFSWFRQLQMSRPLSNSLGPGRRSRVRIVCVYILIDSYTGLVFVRLMNRPATSQIDSRRF